MVDNFAWVLLIVSFVSCITALSVDLPRTTYSRIVHNEFDVMMVSLRHLTSRNLRVEAKSNHTEPYLLQANVSVRFESNSFGMRVQRVT